MAKLRRVAIARGAAPVPMREASSAKVTSVTPFQHRREGRDFIALRGDLPLGDHGPALVRDGCKEVDGRLLAGAAATYGLAVDGHTHQRRGAFVGRVTRVPGRPGAHGVVEGVTVQT